GRGYVSVGFPIPSANFTATLLPRNAGDGGLLLTSKTDLPFPGHYLSSVDAERDALTVLKLLAFEEEIHVHVDDGDLRTEHSFALAGRRFLTLHYEIERLPLPVAPRARARDRGRLRGPRACARARAGRARRRPPRDRRARLPHARA